MRTGSGSREQANNTNIRILSAPSHLPASALVPRRSIIYLAAGAPDPSAPPPFLHSPPHSPPAFELICSCPSQAQASQASGRVRQPVPLSGLLLWILAGCFLPLVGRLNGPSTERPSLSTQSKAATFPSHSHSLPNHPPLSSSQPSPVSEIVTFYLFPCFLSVSPYENIRSRRADLTPSIDCF